MNPQDVQWREKYIFKTRSGKQFVGEVIEIYGHALEIQELTPVKMFSRVFWHVGQEVYLMADIKVISEYK